MLDFLLDLSKEIRNQDLYNAYQLKNSFSLNSLLKIEETILWDSLTNNISNFNRVISRDYIIDRLDFSSFLREKRPAGLFMELKSSLLLV